MISISKYLYGASGGKAPQVDPAWLESLFNLCSVLVDLLGQHVLNGDRYEPFRVQLAGMKEGLRPNLTPAEAAELEQQAARILSGFQAATQQAATSNAIEMQNILGMLNQALMFLAGRSERSMARLQQIQESLQRASSLRDMSAIKSSLADTVKFVQEESVREQQSSTAEIAEFQADVAKVRTSLGSTLKGVPGRPEGVRAISEAVKAVPADQALYVVAFLFDRLEAVTQRYGPTVADELMLRLIKEKLQPIAPEGSAFRWTNSSLVGMFQRTRDLVALRTELAALSRAPLVHKVPLGNRTAVLTISPSHLVAEAEGTAAAEALIAEMDRFTGVRGQ